MDQGVVYLKDQAGIPWSGLTEVLEDTDAKERSALYIDGQKFSRRKFSENLFGSISAYSYPPELDDFLLTPGISKEFDLSYRTTTLTSHRLHFIYNIRTQPSPMTYRMSEIAPYQWAFTTRKVHIPYFKPSAHFVLDLSRAYPGVIARVEEIVYGDEVREPTLPPIGDLLDIFEEQSVLRIYDHGDGTWSAEGPDSIVSMIDATTFKIDWPSVVYLSADTYSVHSL